MSKGKARQLRRGSIPRVKCDKTTRLMREAINQGWTVELTKNGHIKFVAPDGSVVFAASTPSDYRSWRNTRSELRRRGFAT